MGKPAARLTDMHTCPMVTPGTPPIPHVGGPISGPCVPPVLIGFLPAATVGDMCVCVGPPDTIAMGSPTVFIGGKMAARMGDPTAHGGVIVVGCPTVLIGEMGSGGAGGAGMGGLKSFCPTIAGLDALSSQERLAKLKEMEGQMRKSDPAAADQLAKSRHTLEMAMLSNATYDPTNPDLVPLGYKPMSDADLGKVGLARPSMGPDQQIYQTTGPDGSPHYVLAFRGTATAEDAKTDAVQGLGFQDDSYSRGMSSAQKMNDSGQSFEVTGHSKGGGQAAAASAVSGAPATTFNAAGVHEKTLKREGMSEEQIAQANNSGKIQAYNNSRDPLNMVQDNRNTALAGVGAVGGGIATVGGAIPIIGVPLAILGRGLQALAAYAKVTGGLPKAMGDRHEVPPHKNQAKGLSKQAAMEGHGMTHMITALEEQQDQQLKDLCGC
jgi:uncharacterized Zn-binding protein involved in type VI secretion